jgi:hypothetical protein
MPRRPEPQENNRQEELIIRPLSSSPNHMIGCASLRLRALMMALICGLALAPLPAKEKPPAQYQIPIPPPPDFSALDWLQGQWIGKTLPNSPPGNVQLSVTSDLEKHLLVFRGEVALAATLTVPATKESWMGILSPSADRTGFILYLFSSNGFITRYRLTAEGPELYLNPEGGDSPPAGWLFRRTWVRTGPDEFSETVQVAPPGKGFFDYYSVKFARVPPPPKPKPAP